MGPVPGDDLFVYVKFPEGWTKKRTDHSMYTDLLDPQGRVRGSIGYKAAFYDRWARMTVFSRFTVGYREDGFAVCDRGTPVEGDRDGKELFSATYARDEKGGVVDYKEYDEARQKCAAWLKEHYPNCDDPAAYWNDDLTEGEA